LGLATSGCYQILPVCQRQSEIFPHIYFQRKYCEPARSRQLAADLLVKNFPHCRRDDDFPGGPWQPTNGRVTIAATFIDSRNHTGRRE
jgi:hypothetical protein